MSQFEFICADDGQTYYFELEPDDRILNDSPRDEFEHPTSMYFWNRDYRLGDGYTGWESSFREFVENNKEWLDEECYWQPLRVSGDRYADEVSIDYADCSDADGIIYITNIDVSEASAYNQFDREIDEYNVWLKGCLDGRVYELDPNYSIESVPNNWNSQAVMEFVDGCTGFYGYMDTYYGSCEVAKEILEQMDWSVSSIRYLREEY